MLAEAKMANSKATNEEIPASASSTACFDPNPNHSCRTAETADSDVLERSTSFYRTSTKLVTVMSETVSTRTPNKTHKEGSQCSLAGKEDSTVHHAVSSSSYATTGTRYFHNLVFETAFQGCDEWWRSSVAASKSNA